MHLTSLGLVIIFQGNPEGTISGKVGLIWGIPVKTTWIFSFPYPVQMSC